MRQKNDILVALGVLPPAPLPGLPAAGLISKPNINGGQSVTPGNYKLHRAGQCVASVFTGF